MALEAATYISDLVPTNPVNADSLGKADDHIRLLKAVLQNAFPNLSGAMNITHTVLNALPGRVDTLEASYAAAKITGTLAVSNIPSLPASQITSGTFDAARIPTLDAAKIGTGTFDAARIPDLAASKITSGTLGVDRIPSLPASKVTSGSFDVARIPTLTLSKISDSGTMAALNSGTGSTNFRNNSLNDARFAQISGGGLISAQNGGSVTGGANGDIRLVY